MAEISVKSPVLKDREVYTYKLDAQVTLGSACCASVDSIDVSGLTIATCGTTACCGVPTITLSGFEAESGYALDTSREAGIVIKNYGTVAGATAAEAANLIIVNSTYAGSAGSRTVAFSVAAGSGAIDFSTDSFSSAVVEFTLPLKQKDF